MNENLPIDPSMLDEEWLQQPLLFDEAQDVAADWQEIVDDLKEEKLDLKLDLENIKAEVGDNLKTNYEKLGFKKAPTDKATADMVLLDENVKEKTEELRAKSKEVIKADNKLLRANNLVKSLQARKDSLENLCKLYGMNYFSVPNPGHLIDGGKRFIQYQNEKLDNKSAEAVKALNAKKKERLTKDGKTKEEVLNSIKNPETKEAARVAIEAEEFKEKPRTRKRRRT